MNPDQIGEVLPLAFLMLIGFLQWLGKHVASRKAKQEWSKDIQERAEQRRREGKVVYPTEAEPTPAPQQELPPTPIPDLEKPKQQKIPEQNERRRIPMEEVESTQLPELQEYLKQRQAEQGIQEKPSPVIHTPRETLKAKAETTEALPSVNRKKISPLIEDLFSSRKKLQQAILLKEILDKPVALR